MLVGMYVSISMQIQSVGEDVTYMKILPYVVTLPYMVTVTIYSNACPYMVIVNIYGNPYRIW